MIIDDELGEQMVPGYVVSEVVQKFIIYFYKQICDRNVYEIQQIYDEGFNKLTEQYFMKSAWPEAEDISPLVDGDKLFLTLYKELYYRHIYSKLKPTMEHRYASYYNYCELFNYILDETAPSTLVLPNQWMWDIIDEFIYQFQAFCQFRAKIMNKTEDEMISLKENVYKVWNVHSVLNVLYCLVETSRINEQLEVFGNDEDPDTVAGEYGKLPLYKMLGYFSLIGLLRLHSLLGDYYQAIKVLGNVDLNKKSLYSRVPACQVTTYYYVGFAYMMMRRYEDAIRSFVSVLSYVQRAKQVIQTKSYQFEQIKKKTEQMYTLVCICLVLCPQRIDESINQYLREKMLDKMLKMQKGDTSVFEECFSYSCPKFISPIPPNYDSSPANSHLDPFNLQLRMFMVEVQQQSIIPVIRSYLKLYTTMSLSKLASLSELDEGTLQTALLCFKHKQRTLVWTKGNDALNGEFQSSPETDFFIGNDMIHIADTKVARRYGDFFIRQILKIDEFTKSMWKSQQHV
ncbi:eukaryotic translation initiation factor 3 subunit L isoform X3 [Hydra vulgaris]|uniref:Eukaryotic translation initiation factor 3 subunit L n=1 Tax=Hydra vulgaris TaxID=6087 RepID=A0ABM4CDE9_HYDVU